MNINRSLVTLTLITALGITTYTNTTVDPQTIKIKDFYINRIATNSKDVINLERIIVAGVTLRTVSAATTSMLTFGGVVLGDTIVALGALAYGPQLLATYIAVKRLEDIIKKQPELNTLMTKDDKKIFNAGKSVLKGAVLNYINERIALNNEIKKTAQTFITDNPELVKTIPQKKLITALVNYFTWSTAIKTYEQTQQKQAEIRANIKAGIFTPIIKTALTFVNTLISEPTLKNNIKSRKKNMSDLIHKKYPDLGKLVVDLQETADELFEKMNVIKKEHERTGKDLTKEQPAK